jgi:hypothetical protein
VVVAPLGRGGGGPAWGRLAMSDSCSHESHGVAGFALLTI